MVQFNEIPSGIRTPLVAVEIDSSRAQGATAARPFRVLVLGQKITGESGAALTPTQYTRAAEVGAAYGEGSMIHSMAQAAFDQSVDLEATFLAIDDPVGGSKATGTVTFAAASPIAGSVAVYVGGRRYSVPVSSSSTATSLAESLVSKVTADPDAHVTAANVAGVVTLTARHAGAAAGRIDLRANYNSGELTPSGVTVTLAAFSGGAGDVDMTAVLAALPDEKWDAIALPYTDAASLTAVEDELADRFGPMRDLAAVAFAASSVSFGAASTLGNARNSPHVSITSALGSPTPEWQWAAALAMAVAREAYRDPARPLQTVVLNGVMAPEEAGRLSQAERNLLLYDGISTTRVNPAGRVAIERQITTYKQTATGAADTAYLDVETLYILDFLRYDIRETFGRKYPRHKVVNDGAPTGAGTFAISPKVARAELIALARAWEARGLVEGVDDFKGDILVERDQVDTSRLNMFIPPNLVNGLRVVAAQVGFRL